MKPAPSVLALSGGVGGAKLALGLQRVLPPGELAVLVNTGDDFTHLGLRICPDLDTVLYTLAGVVHPKQGWGRDAETFGFMDELRRQGVNIPKLARDGVTLFFTQVFRDGFFHADMHPGNIQVSVAPATFGRYISLDFGIVGTPKRCARAAVICVRRSPAASRRVRSTCSTRSRSPSRNQSGPP